MKYHTPEEDPALEWHAPQHQYHERGRMWYTIATAIFLFCIGYSIYTRAWTFTVVTLLITGIYWHVHTEKPSDKHMRIWKRGFSIGNEFTAWTSCKGYWILKGKDYFELCIEKKSGGDIKIQTGEINPYLIHDLLTSLLPELDDRGESILDTIIRICKL